VCGCCGHASATTQGCRTSGAGRPRPRPGGVVLEFCRHGSMSNVFTPTHPSRSQMHVAVNPMWSSERMGSDLMPVNQQAVQPPESSPAREPLGPSTPSTPGVNAFTMVGIPALSPNEASGPLLASKILNTIGNESETERPFLERRARCPARSSRH
jgi:hypothetical protein